MKLTVLGNPDRYLAPLSGGSSYLVEADGMRILLDAGGGAREALAARGVTRLDAVVLSHFHYDHVLDLPTLRHALDADTLLVIPPGERRRLDALAQAYVFRGPYDMPARVIEAGEGPLRVGPLMLSFAATQHSAPSFATRLESEERSIVYASDSTACEPLLQLARDADLLLMHTLLPTVDPASGHARAHATGETAGKLALEARAKRLLLSHRYWESKDAAMLDAAKGHPRVELARAGGSHVVGG